MFDPDAAHEGGRYAGEEFEKHGEAEGRKERSFGSGLLPVSSIPQELPARDVGRDGGTGDSNLEHLGEYKFNTDSSTDHRRQPCSHLLDGAPSLGHCVRVCLVSVSQTTAVVHL